MESFLQKYDKHVILAGVVFLLLFGRMKSIKNIFLRNLLLLFGPIIGFGFAISFFMYPELIAKNTSMFFGLLGAWCVILGIFTQMYLGGPIQSIRQQIDEFLEGKKQNDGAERFQNNYLHPDIDRTSQFIGKSLEILKEFKEELRSGRELKSEVEFAAEIQQHVLKKREVDVPSLAIVADSKSATEVGGDSYDIIKRGNNYYIYLGDVTGHGVASGFVMMMANALISGFSKLLINSAEIIASTNEILKPRVKSNMLMTLLMVRWDEENRKMYMTGAGHEYLLIYKRQQKKAFKLKSGGVPLCMMKDSSKLLKEVQISFDPGDFIIMYTDGITEAKNSTRSDAVLFGIDRLVEAIEKADIAENAQDMFQAITVSLSNFMGYANRQLDDITLIVIHYPEISAQKRFEKKVIAKEFLAEWNWDEKEV